MDYTPRQAAAFHALADERHRNEALTQYTTIRTAVWSDRSGDRQFRHALGES